MTLGEGKKKVYELLDEYSSGGEITVDDDIELKLADFFDMAQKRVAQVKRILAIKEIKRRDGVTEYAMPSGFGSLYRVWRDGQVTVSSHAPAKGATAISHNFYHILLHESLNLFSFWKQKF